MTTFDFIIQLFYLVDHQLTAAGQNQQQTQAKLYPPEVSDFSTTVPPPRRRPRRRGNACHQKGNLNVWIRLG